ncbi:hypothetical protein FRC08_000095 [Ceratobasidium sp. 394]|nr:hypothetical protein FRC08_000095 [Ceratobasidium sp. 394]
MSESLTSCANAHNASGQESDIYRTKCRLPAEICSLILSHASRQSLVATTRVSRLLFDSTIPYLWRTVNIESVLALFPGFFQQNSPDAGSFEVELPRKLPDVRFERLSIYAPHIYRLCCSQAWLAHKGHSRHQLAWVTLTHHMIDRALLPNLKMLVLEGKLVVNHNLHAALDIVDALVLPGKNLVHCSFNIQLEGCSSSVHDKAQRTLGAILSRSHKLAHLSLRSNLMWEVPGPSNVGCFPLQATVPQALTYLDISPELLTGSFLTWMGQLPELKTLRISLPGLTERHTANCSSAFLPPGAFRALRCLRIKSVSLSAMLYWWRLPLVNHLTEAAIYGDASWNTTELFTLIASESPNLVKLELGMHIASVIDPPFLDPLRSLELHELRVTRLRIRSKDAIRTIGNMWPTLEVLELGFTVVDLRDLLCVYNVLPELKYLTMSLPTELSPEASKLTEEFHPLNNSKTWREFSFTLVSWTNWLKESNVDALARSVSKRNSLGLNK